MGRRLDTPFSIIVARALSSAARLASERDVTIQNRRWRDLYQHRRRIHFGNLRGSLALPCFAREYVWKPRQVISLFNSLYRGYPAGTLIFWTPAIAVTSHLS